MIFKTLYKELRRIYSSFFKPPNADLGFIRRERFAIAYAISSFTFFVISSFLIFKQLEDPVFMEKATIKAAPEARHIKFEFNAKDFTFSKTEEKKNLDQEKNCS